MKLGLGSFACAWAAGAPGFAVQEPLTAKGLIERASKVGLSLVQIADNIPLAACTYAELEDIRDVAGARGVEVEIGMRGSNGDNLLRHIELCRFFKSKILRIVIDTETDRPSVDEIIERLKAITPELRSAGVTLAVENHDRFDAATFARIVSEVNSSHVGICIDTVNSFGALEGPDVVISTLAPFAASVHIKDFTITRASHMMGFEITGAPAGQGRLDIPDLLRRIRETGQDPNAILEHWPSPEADLSATIAKEARWIEESIAYLRTLIPE